MICELKSLQVSVPKGSFCNLNVKVNIGLPPDTVYDIVTDPENKRVFKNIKVRYLSTILKRPRLITIFSTKVVLKA